MSDTFNVTAAWSKASYTVGDQMTVNITGSNTHTTDPSSTTETFAGGGLSLVSDSGATISVTVSEVAIVRPVPGTTVTEAVFVDAPAGSVLTLGGRQFTVSADRKSLTATA